MTKYRLALLIQLADCTAVQCNLTHHQFNILHSFRKGFSWEGYHKASFSLGEFQIYFVKTELLPQLS